MISEAVAFLRAARVSEYGFLIPFGLMGAGTILFLLYAKLLDKVIGGKSAVHDFTDPHLDPVDLTRGGT